MIASESELEADVHELTNLFRESLDTYWGEVRHLLRERGVEPLTTLLVDKWPDEESDFLLVLTAEGHAVEVEYFDVLPERGRLTSSLGLWTEVLPGTREHALYEKQLETARLILEEENRAG